MTRRLPIRIQPGDKNCWAPLPPSEVTIAEMLKAEGYIGKWWLTSSFDEPGIHPNDQGFADFPIALHRQREASLDAP